MTKYKKTRFWTILIGALLSATVISAAASVKTGIYWSDIHGGNGELITPESSDFIVIDVSRLPKGDEKSEIQTPDSIIGAIGPLASVPSMTHEEVDIIEMLPGGGDSSDNTVASEDFRQPVTKKYWNELLIKPGDTLSAIAERYHLSAKDITTANELKDKDKLQQGQVLYIPEDSDRVLDTLQYVRFLRVREETEKKQALPLKVTAYVVQNGDSLWSIANTFNLDVNTLFGSNKLSDVNRLKLGAVLRVPNQDGVFIKVKKGDNVKKLANQYSIYSTAVLAANSLKSESDIKIGEELFLPGAKAVAYVESGSDKTKKTKDSTPNLVQAVRGFGWPVIGQISSPFGWRRDPLGRGRDYHTGIDIRGPRGRTITASAAGRVVYAGWMSGYGRTVVINHTGGYTTLYAHCHTLNTGTGQQVRRGQTIAAVGSTGRSTGNHLHFEIRKNGVPTNPLKLLR